MGASEEKMEERVDDDVVRSRLLRASQEEREAVCACAFVSALMCASRHNDNKQFGCNIKVNGCQVRPKSGSAHREMPGMPDGMNAEH